MQDGDKKEAAPAEKGEGEGMETTGVRTVEGASCYCMTCMHARVVCVLREITPFVLFGI